MAKANITDRVQVS